MTYLPEYDNWKLQSPPESDFDVWLDRLTEDQVVELCEPLIKKMWQTGDEQVLDCLYEHYQDLREHGRE